ncbi:hypothetical protein BpHYR1_023565 [Brachionus plicatilis]|uniref:Uncharacterized protein n=1 Tax=Brachionus plicatilis TaxID=10195 RepID=A0A3M7PYW0_BRAPC|nr:hypothetical protein BpHYR1_023565 [Brachionus plicatilis]
MNKYKEINFWFRLDNLKSDIRSFIFDNNSKPHSLKSLENGKINRTKITNKSDEICIESIGKGFSQQKRLFIHLTVSIGQTFFSRNFAIFSSPNSIIIIITIFYAKYGESWYRSSTI